MPGSNASLGPTRRKAAARWPFYAAKSLKKPPSTGRHFRQSFPHARRRRAFLRHRRQPHHPYAKSPCAHRPYELSISRDRKGALVRRRLRSTPMGFPYEEDTRHFHSIAEKTLRPFGQHLYPQFSAEAKKYFYIPHWKKSAASAAFSLTISIPAILKKTARCGRPWAAVF